MTRILVQRGSAGGSSSNPNRSSLPSSSARLEPNIAPQAFKEDEIGDVPEKVVVDEPLGIGFNDCNVPRSEVLLVESVHSDMNESRSDEIADGQKVGDNIVIPGNLNCESGVLSISERVNVENEVSARSNSLETGNQTSYPPPPPVPPPKTASPNFNTRRSVSSSSDVRIGPSRRPVVWPVVSTRTSPTGSRPSSPRSRSEEGYNSADEQNPNFLSSYDDSERERQFEIDIRRVKGLEVKRMLEDGNCLFRAIADQVYGDPELYDLTRQMCIDYMERERDHFTQFITEGFSSYCKRKRRDKVYGNNLEIQGFAEMYNRPIHIHSYSTEPINIFHGSYNTDSPPIRLSYHHGNHYNSLVDPRRITVGAGLGFSCLRGANVDNVQVKAAVKAQQDQQIDNALLAEGRFYSDLELTEKEIERMVMEASRSEFKQQQSRRDSSTSSAEPSSSGTSKKVVISGSMEVVLSMGFSYLQVIEAYSIFGEDVDSMVCYLLETDTTSRRKGKATE